MDNKRNKGGRRVVERQRKNPKLDPSTNRYSVNFRSEEDMRFLKMFDRSGMTSKSAFIKARACRKIQQNFKRVKKPLL